MEAINKTIINSYFGLFERMNYREKLEMIEKMIRSIKKEEEKKETLREKKFFATSGAWESDMSADEIIKDIRESRRFRNREVEL